MSGDRLRDRLREVCAELTELLGSYQFRLEEQERARALLAEAQPVSTPEPVGPTDEEIDAMEREHWQSERVVSSRGGLQLEESFNYRDFARAVLARWGRPAPEPVSVAERMPTAADCDAEGRCWVHQPCTVNPETPYWTLLASKCANANYGATYWLPHWAVPMPQEQADA
jgi:hypothetical protein